jgi:hypothetical protein
MSNTPHEMDEDDFEYFEEYVEDDFDDPYAEYDDAYEALTNFEPIQKDGSPKGSLTDNLRHHKANRDGAHKRARRARRDAKGYRINKNDLGDD